MTGAGMARARALAVLRIRSLALAAALLPAACAVVLLASGTTAGLGGSAGGGWTALRWAVVGCAVLVLLLACGVAAVLARARPAESPTVPLDEAAAPELYRMVRELAQRLDVPAPSAIALTPDCDSWLEERKEPSGRRRRDLSPQTVRPPGGPRGGGPEGDGSRPERGVPAGRGGAEPSAPVLVIGSPFLWWMRVAELRALLAPVVAGTGPSADAEVAAARRFVRSLDAAAAFGVPAPAAPQELLPTGNASGRPSLALRQPPAVPPSFSAALAGAAAALRRPVDGFLRWVARFLLRASRVHAAEMERAVAAWASERAQQVDYGLRIAAQEQVGLAYAGWDRLLTRVALPAWRMGRWPSRLHAGVVAALTELSRRDRLAEGFETRLGERPACDLLEQPGAVDEAASLLAARLFHGGRARPGPDWSPVAWEEYPQEVVDRIWRTQAARLHRVLDELEPGSCTDGRATVARVVDRLSSGGGEELAARLMILVLRDEAARSTETRGAGAVEASPAPPIAPLFPMQQPRTAREVLTEHVAALVCCAAVDMAGAAPGLDWLDGPALLIEGARRADLTSAVLSLAEHEDAGPLRAWLTGAGVPLEKPVRLV